MRATVLSLLTCVVIAAPVLGIDGANDSPPSAQVGSPKFLNRINKIYVGSLGEESNSEAVRKQLNDALIKGKLFIIVDSLEQADAVFTEIGHGERDLLRPSDARLILDCSPKGALVLVGKDKRVAWLYPIDSKTLFKPHRKGSHALIDKFVADLRKSQYMECDAVSQAWVSKYRGLGEP